ncbi:hypothetical protein OL548_28010 [Lysinibacillus sp. MHQ-1]|nr:hypothetical protein OL548_28010 [Lysinibacillus sp. MHQ-1]
MRTMICTKKSRVQGYDKDMSLTFYFVGTKFMLLDYIAYNRADFTVTIDGVSEAASAKRLWYKKSVYIL